MRWGRGSFAAARLLVLVACSGGGNGRVAPHGGSDAGAPDASAADAGGFDAGEPDGGAPDAGPPDAGLPDGGGRDAGAPDAGALDAGAPDAGPPDAGLPDAGQGDAGTPDAGAWADCAGLVPQPPLPGPHRARLQGPPGGSDPDYRCLAGDSDGSGDVLLGSQKERQPHDTPMQFYRASGEPAGAYTAVGFVALPQAVGFLGLDIYGGNFEHDVLALAGDGTLLRRDGDEHRSGFEAEDPLGGMVVWAAEELSPDGDLQSFDSTGTLRWSLPLHLGGFLEAIGVDRAGDVLLLSRHANGDVPDGLDGQWVSREGQPLGLPFSAVRMGDDRPSDYALYPQVGSGLFLRRVSPGGATWLRAFAARAREGTVVPRWLTARPDDTLHRVRGGKGYALLPPPEQTVARCAQAIEIVSPSGHACGSVELPITTTGCTTGSVAVGEDGTVIQRLPFDDAACSHDHCPCDWRWWSGLLR